MNIKKLFLPLVLSILFGYCCGRYVCRVYKYKVDVVLEDSKVYLLQLGTYSSVDSMKKNTSLSNYIYYYDDGVYNSVLAVTKNKDNVDKIKDLYDLDIYVLEYYLDDDSLNEKIDEYDYMISNSDSEEEVKKIISDMLIMYQDNNLIKLANDV